MSKGKKDFNPNLHYAEQVDFWKRKEQEIKRIRQAALELGCQEEDGAYYYPKPKPNNIPLKYRVTKKKATK